MASLTVMLKKEMAIGTDAVGARAVVEGAMATATTPLHSLKKVLPRSRKLLWVVLTQKEALMTFTKDMEAIGTLTVWSEQEHSQQEAHDNALRLKKEAQAEKATANLESVPTILQKLVEMRGEGVGGDVLMGGGGRLRIFEVAFCV